MSWLDLIPTSMAYLGSVCLGLAAVLVIIDMPGGAPWSKIAGWLAVIGGFGALGGAGGWIGTHIVSGSEQAVSFAQQYLGQLIGVGAIVVVLALGAAWAYARLGTKGAHGGGKGITKKVRGLLVCAVLAIVGAAAAALIPMAYEAANWAVATAGGAVQTALASI